MINPMVTRERYCRTRRTLASLSAFLQRSLLVDGRLERVRAGRLLLLMQGLLVLTTSRFLGASTSDTASLLIISAVMALLLAGSYGLNWSRLPVAATSLFPAMTIVAFLVLGVQTAPTFAPVTGFLTLSFVYVGLTQTARVSCGLTPAAAVALAAIYGTFSTAIGIRTLVAMTVWLTTSLVLTWLTAGHVAAAEVLRRSAHLDGLTGIFNRRDLDLRLAELPGGETITVCDIDHFKRINDTDGHAAGDEVLRRFGLLLRTELRAEDYCARLGGEEFVIILPPDLPGSQQVLIERLRSRWARLQPGVTFSTGSAVNHVRRTSQATLAQADRALYLAKEGGRNTDRTEMHLGGVGPGARRPDRLLGA